RSTAGTSTSAPWRPSGGAVAERRVAALDAEIARLTRLRDRLASLVAPPPTAVLDADSTGSQHARS
ncbi:hypothetical protein AB0L05_42030, partial [Nonomuraea pusilla]|uniref:hypothetical protein n=1 Tax=Nonomuraea pusilla TaxID=46177 RepID=UPI00342D03D1